MRRDRYRAKDIETERAIEIKGQTDKNAHRKPVHYPEYGALLFTITIYYLLRVPTFITAQASKMYLRESLL